MRSIAIKTESAEPQGGAAPIAEIHYPLARSYGPWLGIVKQNLEVIPLWVIKIVPSALPAYAGIEFRADGTIFNHPERKLSICFDDLEDSYSSTQTLFQFLVRRPTE